MHGKSPSMYHRNTIIICAKQCASPFHTFPHFNPHFTDEETQRDQDTCLISHSFGINLAVLGKLNSDQETEPVTRVCQEAPSSSSPHSPPQPSPGAVRLPQSPHGMLPSPLPAQWVALPATSEPFSCLAQAYLCQVQHL